MKGEEDIDQTPKSSDTPEDGNENASQELTIGHSKTQSENMEVHHHPDLHHKRKHFKEYFLEFLMIFIAVTLGFFAESYREHIKDNEEIYENIQSVLADLESDVAHFNVNIYGYSAADSLISLLHSDISHTQQIYFYARATTANVGFFYTNSKTFDQMKAAGMLKLIHPRKLLDSLGFYYVTFQLLIEQDDVVRHENDNVHKGNYLLFDSYVFSKMKVVFDSI